MCCPRLKGTFSLLSNQPYTILWSEFLYSCKFFRYLAYSSGDCSSIPGSFSLILSESVQSEQADNANTEKAASAIPLNDFLYNFIIIQHLLLLFSCPPYVSSHVVRSTQIAVYCLLHVFSITCIFFRRIRHTACTFLAINNSTTQVTFTGCRQQFGIACTAIVSPSFVT